MNIKISPKDLRFIIDMLSYAADSLYDDTSNGPEDMKQLEIDARKCTKLSYELAIALDNQ